jgi:hypothetical protein
MDCGCGEVCEKCHDAYISKVTPKTILRHLTNLLRLDKFGTFNIFYDKYTRNNIGPVLLLYAVHTPNRVHFAALILSTTYGTPYKTSLDFRDRMFMQLYKMGHLETRALAEKYPPSHKIRDLVDPLKRRVISGFSDIIIFTSN